MKWGKVRKVSVPYYRLSALGERTAVERAVLDCFADVLGLDGFALPKVGDRACDFQDPVVGAGAQVELFHGIAQQDHAPCMASRSRARPPAYGCSVQTLKAMKTFKISARPLLAFAFWL